MSANCSTAELDRYFEVLHTKKIGKIWQKPSKFIVERSCVKGICQQCWSPLRSIKATKSPANLWAFMITAWYYLFHDHHENVLEGFTRFSWISDQFFTTSPLDCKWFSQIEGWISSRYGSHTPQASLDDGQGIGGKPHAVMTTPDACILSNNPWKKLPASRLYAPHLRNWSRSVLLYEIAAYVRYITDVRFHLLRAMIEGKQVITYTSAVPRAPTDRPLGTLVVNSFYRGSAHWNHTSNVHMLRNPVIQSIASRNGWREASHCTKLFSFHIIWKRSL